MNHLVAQLRPKVNNSIQIEPPRTHKQLQSRLVALDTRYADQDICVVRVVVKLSHLFKVSKVEGTCLFPLYITHLVKLALADSKGHLASFCCRRDFEMVGRSPRPVRAQVHASFFECRPHVTRAVQVCEVGMFALGLKETRMAGLDAQHAGPVLKGPIRNFAFENGVELASQSLAQHLKEKAASKLTKSPPRKFSSTSRISLTRRALLFKLGVD